MNPSNSDFFNPYDVFGVTPLSSLQELSKAYYRLALICHPDKGGDGESMKSLAIAYRWLKDQLDTVHQHKTTFDEVFTDAMKEATFVPNFTDVLSESYGYTHELFDSICNDVALDGKWRDMLFIPIFEITLHDLKTVPSLDILKDHVKNQLEIFMKGNPFTSDTNDTDMMWESSIKQGYGDRMENQLPFHYASSAINYQKDMVVYTEPSGCFAQPGGGPIMTPSKQDDFTVYDDLSMCDYERAFYSYSEDFKKLEEQMEGRINMDVKDLYEQEKEDRAGCQRDNENMESLTLEFASKMGPPPLSNPVDPPLSSAMESMEST